MICYLRSRLALQSIYMIYNQISTNTDRMTCQSEKLKPKITHKLAYKYNFMLTSNASINGAEGVCSALTHRTTTFKSVILNNTRYI